MKTQSDKPATRGTVVVGEDDESGPEDATTKGIVDYSSTRGPGRTARSGLAACRRAFLQGVETLLKDLGASEGEKSARTSLHTHVSD